MSENMRFWIAGATVLSLSIGGCASAATGRGPAPGDTDPAIEVDDLALRAELFASDAMAGRETGAPGAEAAAQYLAAEVARLDLRPAGDDGGFLQAVPLQRTVTTTEVSADLGGTTIELGSDDILHVSGLGGLPTSSRATGSGNLVFGGHLVDPTVGADELSIDQIRNAVLIVRLAVPEGVNPSTTTPRIPLAAAFSPASPVAAILLVAEEAEEEFWGYASELGSKGELAIAGGGPPPPSGNTPPFFLISEAAAERLIGADLEEARAPRRDLGTLTFSVEKRVEPVEAWNVAAILPGSDPARADEYVTLGAHYDHVGIGEPVDGDSIYNGADDNASGTVTLLEIAEALAHRPTADRPARSVLFVWNTAEESGLLGSEHFTDYPTVPREAIVSHVNIDMVGRNSPDSLFVVGSRRIATGLGDLLEEVNRARPDAFAFDYSYDAPGHPEMIYCRSDHYNYARYGIPIIFLTSGLHDDYHAPSDETELLDFEKMAAVADLLLDLTVELGNSPSRPVVDQPVPPLGTPCQ